jgi:hypothetical protein
MPFLQSQEDCMSAALVERVDEAQKGPTLIVTEPKTATAKTVADPHPLLPVFVLGAIALIGAFALVGTIMALLALRGTGLTSPF